MSTTNPVDEALTVFVVILISFSCGAAVMWFYLDDSKLIRTREEWEAATKKGDNEPR